MRGRVAGEERGGGERRGRGEEEGEGRGRRGKERGSE